MKINKIIYIILTAFLALSIGSCSKEKKIKEYFIEAYKDCYIARIRFTDTTKAKEEIKRILKKYGFTEKSFLDFKEKYSKNPKDFKEMLDSADVRVKRELLKYRNYE